MKPRFSPVVALTLICVVVICSAVARALRIASEWGEILGAWRAMVASMLMISAPVVRMRSPTFCSRWRLLASFHWGAVSGNCWPMSGIAAAPSRASQMAWVRASASEWPCSPVGWGMSMPPRISRRPATRGWMSKPQPMRIMTGPPFRGGFPG